MISKEVKLMAILKVIRIHQYLDDCLVRARSHQVCLQNTQELVEPTAQNTRTSILTDLSGLSIYVSDRSANSHRKASSPRPTAYETHTVASQKQLEGTRNTRQGDSYPQVPAPPSTMVTGRRQCTRRPTITPNKTCSANLYRHIKRRVGRSLE